MIDCYVFVPIASMFFLDKSIYNSVKVSNLFFVFVFCFCCGAYLCDKAARLLNTIWYLSTMFSLLFGN